MEELQKYLEYFADNPYLTFGVVAVGLILVLVLVVRMASRKPKMIKAFSDTSGAVYVSTHAVIDLVRATCEHIEGVSKPRVRLKDKRGVTHLDLHLRLESGSRIREIRDALRQHLKGTLQDNLGIENLGNITVIVSEYKAGPLDAISVHPPAPAPEKAPEADEPPPEEPEPDGSEEEDEEKDGLARPHAPEPGQRTAADLLAEKEEESTDSDDPPEKRDSGEERKSF